MGCFRPIDVWPAAPPAKGFVFTRSKSFVDRPATQIPCGKCMACRIQRQDEWRTRLILEGQQHACASFVTLTYAPEHIPADYSLSVRHAQTWMKRLRFTLGETKIRYFLCGEYGERNLRPHYHAIIYGFDFPDRTPWRATKTGATSFRSELLEKTWNLGHCEVGTFTPQSAGYVASYSIKKMGGELAKTHYSRMHPQTGEIHQVLPEFVLMSSRPGIGRGWYDENARDAFPSDFLIIDGKRKPVPRYFKRLLDTGDVKTALKVDAKRKAHGRERKDHPDNHWRRRQDREEYAHYRDKQRHKKELDE